ncbi:MAG: hypothetical protein AVDCRST_MAG37-899 [uncultured Rubrobacteraceae bacterium]|uniref:Uncharacterized protein n=1 Tax=uncultured Rubrobacteraceae bacterium TaxID=349277 RepID=A0A6J4QE73_9ACTN|nr:MAG: hypothetical protein AVDCRST_MAG37-899 [uncultured Rubrobacteraceae bacterium]
MRSKGALTSSLPEATAACGGSTAHRKKVLVLGTMTEERRFLDEQ